MRLAPFKLERYFERYEFNVPYLLSSSDAETIGMDELLALADDELGAAWRSLKLGYTEVRGHPLLRAEHLELHGRLLEGLVSDHPVLEVAVRTRGAFAPGVPALAAQPVDAVFDTVFRGLTDFAPKPWSERFREIAANNGRIEITEARAVQGETLAVGTGNLSISASGRLQGQLDLTVAGLEPFLKSINAEQMVQASPSVDRLAGALDRLSPGLGQAAKQQVGANLATGINLLGRKTTLEGRPAVSLPLRFDDGRMFLGPIPLGDSPALF